MLRRAAIASAVGVALLSVACSDSSNRTMPPAPSFQSLARPGGGGLSCNFSTITKYVKRYFNLTEAKTVLGSVSLMQSAGKATTGAQSAGFDIFVHISSNVSAGNPDFQDASALTNNVLACMYTDPAQLPATFPEDFTVATNPAAHGAFEVRGGGADPATAPVFSRPVTSPFSGIAPPATVAWSDMLTSDPAPNRILVYGRPGGGAQTYDWKVVPHNTVFDPQALVGVCIDPNASPNALLHEQNVGLLTLSDAYFLDPNSATSPCSQVAMQQLSWPALVARNMTRWGASLLAPAPLSASGGLNPGGLGGSTGGIRSEFGPQEVDSITLTFLVQPSDINLGQVISPPVQIQATAFGTTTPVGGVQVSVIAFNNNGVPDTLLGTQPQTTLNNGIATFPDLQDTKTGGYKLVATGTYPGRTIFVVPDTSARYNVRP